MGDLTNDPWESANKPLEGNAGRILYQLRLQGDELETRQAWLEELAENTICPICDGEIKFNEKDDVVIKVMKETIIKCKNNSVETYVGGQIADNEKFIKELTSIGLTGVSVNPDLKTIYKIRKFYSNLEK